METRPVFDNLSPLDHRYYEANPELFDSLSGYLSEAASIRFCVQVEVALLLAHLARTGMDTDLNRAAAAKLPDLVSPDEVYDEERETKHNIRALVRVIKRHLPDELSPLVHLGATSVDILDTAMALRVRGATREVVVPLLIGLEEELIRIVRGHAGTLQIGRTHGQHGVPITFGFALGEYVSRLGQSIEKIISLAGDLRGKISGAVGAYNSTSMLTSDPVAFESAILADLGLRPGDHATQIVQPEYLLRLLLEMNTAFGVLANLADDLRNLQRTEIDEVREGFTAGQVGSSTMPQKRNPWNSEHVKSLWKTFAPRVVTFFSDQISEHQRDLTNSASSRFVADYVVGFAAAAARMRKILSGLQVNSERMRKNAGLTGDLALAEAAYSLLASQGVSDAHERIRVATLGAERDGESLVTMLRAESDTWETLQTALKAVSVQSPDEFFSDPGNYTGRAREIALQLADTYEMRMNRLGEESFK
jgi:adenylosuccinate lyase